MNKLLVKRSSTIASCEGVNENKKIKLPESAVYQSINEELKEKTNQFWAPKKKANIKI